MSLFGRLEKMNEKRHPFCTMIVPAAGSSHRMGGENKLLLPLEGIPVLMRTLMAVDHAQCVDEIVVATREDLLLEIADLCARCGLSKPVRVVKGGESRTASVLAAALEADPRAELMAIHDGARPLVRFEMIDKLIKEGAKTYAIAPAIPVTDTIKIADHNGLIRGTPDRKELFAVQTPQVFQANILKAALQAVLDSGHEVTDDCAAVEQLGKEVYLAEGDRENIKITTPIDMDVARAILRRREGL